MSDDSRVIQSTTGVSQTLSGLLEHYSPTGEEGAAVAWLIERMGALGYDRAYRDPAGNAIGVMGTGSRQLILLGHIDTVPGLIPVRVSGDLLYGRGSVDAKGPLAAFVDAAAAVGPRAGWQLVVIGAVDEEGDSAGARFLTGQYRPEYAVVGEPSRWDRITLGYKGSAMAEILVRKPLAHSAGPGENACEAAVRVWQAVQAWADDYNRGIERVFDQVQPSLRSMDSGGDGFTEWARLRIVARLPASFPPEAWYQRLAGLVGEGEVLALGTPTPAFKAEKNTALVRALLSGIRAAGGSPGFVLKTGTADLNLVAPAWSCPAAAYGPGDSSLDHTPDEHVSLREYALAVAVLKTTLCALTTG